MEYMSCPEAAKSGAFLKGGYSGFVRMPAYLAFQKSVICGLYQR